MRRLVFGSNWVYGVAWLLPLLLAAGCSGGKSKVSGRVIFKGAALPGGQVLFRPADPKQNAVNAEIDAQGNYEAVLPAGDVKVSVDNRALQPPPARSGGGLPPGLPFSPEAKKVFQGKREPAAPPAGGDNAPAKPAGRYIPIPDRYYDVDTSGLEFKVQGRDMKQDINLQP